MRSCEELTSLIILAPSQRRRRARMKVIVETTLSLTERLNKFLIKLLFFAIFQATYCRFLLEECYRSCMWRLVESFTRLKLSAPMASRLLKVLERVQQQQQPSRLRLAGNNKLFEVILSTLLFLFGFSKHNYLFRVFAFPWCRLITS